MIREIVLICFFLLSFSLLANDKNVDPVIMTISGNDILRSEFEYSFNKSNYGKKIVDKENIKEYLNSFVDYKLKVTAALENKIDTTNSFVQEYDNYKLLHLKKYLIDTVYIDSIAHKVYDKVKESLGDSDLLLVSHIFITCTDKSSEETQKAAKQKIDTLYTSILNGATFSKLAEKYSDDKGSSYKGGELPWLGPESSSQKFMQMAYSLNSGQVSKPFLTEQGYEIIKMLDRKPLESFENKKEEILALLKTNNIESQALESGITRRIAMSQNKASRDDIINKALGDAYADNPRLKLLLKEYRDGLLMYEATDKLVWKPASKDRIGLSNFFKKNIKNYKWKSPRFKGFLLYAKNKEILDKVMKIVAPYNNKIEAVNELKKQLGQDVLKKVIVKYSVYKDGDDSRVDHLRFGKPAPKAFRFMPYYNVVGHMISAPVEYTDDIKRVLSDYQNYKEQQWVKSLHNKYSVKINNDVLMTVNNH